MKKRLIFGLAGVVATAAVCVGVSTNNSNRYNNLTLANIEALSQSEAGNNRLTLKYCSAWSIGWGCGPSGQYYCASDC